MFGKLLSVATVGSSLASLGLLHRFLSGIITIVILAIITAFMLCIFLGCGFALAYFCLLHYGVDPFTAGMTIGTAALLITGTLIAVTVGQLRQLRELSYQSTRRPGTGILEIGNVAEAFINGFLNATK